MENITFNHFFPTDSKKHFTIRRINELNREEIEHNYLPHLHDFYSIFWITSGEAIHATDFVEYSLKENTILFVPPGLKHRMYIDDSVDGIIILFNEEFIQYNKTNVVPLKEFKLFNNPEYKSIIKLPEEKQKQFYIICNQISDEFRQNDNYSEDIVFNLIHLFLLESRRIFDLQNVNNNHNTEQTPDATIIKFKQLIENKFIEQKNVTAYAEMLNINPSCLNELSKRTTGITAGELIRNRIIEEAKKLLFSSSLSGKEIGFKLGFDDPAYFSRFFRKYTNMTLSEFRKHSRKKYH